MAEDGTPLNEDALKQEIANFKERYQDSSEDASVKSEEFMEFQKDFLPLHYTFYENACNFCGNLIAIKADPKKADKLEEALATSHINTTPSGVTAFAILFPMAFIILGILSTFIFTTLFMGGEGLMFFTVIFLFFGLGMIVPLTTLPLVLANGWRLKASNQMVLSIFYIVSYMRHTSNLELAMKFTSEHISPPLSLDFKKVIWNVETSTFSSVKDSLDNYLDSWKEFNMEFVESMHLVESSLYEPNDEKRVVALEKALSLILEATFEKMLHFAQNLKGPITMLHMLGVILPILGLVILPLVISFMEGVRWYHISVLYNVILPVIVLYMGKVILTTRPTGYGQADITEVNPELKKHTMLSISIGGKKTYTINPKWIAGIIIVIFIFIGMSPIIIHSFTADNPFDIILNKKDQIVMTTNKDEMRSAQYAFLGYKQTEGGGILGPFGLGATLLSISIPLGLALGISFYFKAVTKKLVTIREKTKALENEFASALFQLGNRLGDGIPAEIAFSKVSEIMDGTLTGSFFDIVTTNIATLGMGVEDSLFDKKYGAINKFPSALIESSMKVFVESARKGPQVASHALINISTYIKEMHRVDERLKDLMSEISGSMKSQINFLAPLISGIVIGLTSMITTILNTLGNQIGDVSTGAGVGDQAGLLSLFGEGIPTFYFQVIVGVYVVQITYILTGMLNTIESGYDPLNEKFLLGQNIKKSGMMYSTVAFVIILLFNLIAGSVVSGLNIS